MKTESNFSCHPQVIPHTQNLKRREMINFEQYFSDKSREQKEKENTEKKEDNKNNEDS